jgi:transposase InsO family protein
MGHPGRDRTNSLVRERFYWPRMTSDIENWVQHCDRCLKRKKEPHRAPLVNIITTQPMELVCIDYLTLEPSKGGQHSILVITDHFTRYAQAIVTKNQTARTTADALFHNFIVHYGIPQKIHSDQGANFMSHLIKELCTLTGTKKSRTTPYHSMGNGMTERFNRTLLEMLGTLEPEKKKNWKAHVGPLVHTYNCTRHNSTNQSPYFLMFGRQPKLPIDLAFELITEKERKPHTTYIQEIRERLVQAYTLASEASIKAQTKRKEGYDLRTR